MKTVTFRRSLAIGLLILFAGVIGVPSNGLANLNDGLMGYWKCDEGSGDTLHDYSGHNNHGVISGASWISGVSGSALEIEGTDIVHSFPASYDDSITTALTVAAWIKWYGPNSYGRASYIFDGRGDYSPQGFLFGIDRDGTLYFHMCQGASSEIQSICHVFPYTWTHVAVVFDDASNTLRIFVNGWQDNIVTTTDAFHNSGANPAIGNNRWQDGIYTPLNGVIDEICIYNRALSAAEIQALYNPGSGLVGYWNFDEGSGDTLHDYSGHNNHGVISGASWTSGESGSALEIEGSDIVHSIPASYDDSIDSALTVTAWVKWYGPDALQHNSYIFDGREGSSGHGFLFYIYSEERKLSFHMNRDSGSGIESTHPLPDSTWIHVAVVFDDNSNTLRAFINGCLDNDSTTTYSYINISSDHPALGNNHWGPGSAPFNGVLDEVRIYNRALSEAEIKLLSCSYIHRGHVDGDTLINASDVVYLINYLFIGGPPPDPLANGDVNGDCVINVSDVVYLINYLFSGGPPPQPCSCSNNPPMSSAGLQQSLNKTTKTASVGFGQVNKIKDGSFEIPLEGEVDMDVAGLQFEITYDHNVVTLLEPALTSRTEGLQVFSSAKDGIQRIGIVDLSGRNHVPAGGSSLIVLRGRGTDLSSIKIKKAILVDKEANKIPVEIVGEMKKGEEGSDVKESVVPKDFSLSQNLPNPFNPETEISYGLPKDSWVKLSIYNIRGQKVKTLVDGFEAAGHKTVIWNGKSEEGEQVASGIYFYRLDAGEFTATKKMILLR